MFFILLICICITCSCALIGNYIKSNEPRNKRIKYQEGISYYIIQDDLEKNTFLTIKMQFLAFENNNTYKFIAETDVQLTLNQNLLIVNMLSQDFNFKVLHFFVTDYHNFHTINKQKCEQSLETKMQIIEKIDYYKKVKRNSIDFLDVTEDNAKPLYKFLRKKITDFANKYKNMKDYAKNKEKNKKRETEISIHGKKFNLRRVKCTSLELYNDNKKIMYKQTEKIKRLLDKSIFDFDEFYQLVDVKVKLNKPIEQTLYKAIEFQLNMFIENNKEILCILLPKMDGFSQYYNKNQDDVIFFVDIKHVYMVLAMMSILETILDCVQEENKIVTQIMDSFMQKEYKVSCFNKHDLYKMLKYTLLQYEIEKMFFYIIQPFIPHENFINLANLYQIERACRADNYKCTANRFCYNPPNNYERPILRNSNFLYLSYDTVVLNDDGTVKSAQHVFFNYLVSEFYLPNLCLSIFTYPNILNQPIYNNFFSKYILANQDKLTSETIKQYNKCVAVHNHMKGIFEQNNLNSIFKQGVSNLEAIKNDNCSYIVLVDEQINYKKIQLCKKIFKTTEQRENKYINFYLVVTYILNCISYKIITLNHFSNFSCDITKNETKITKAIEYYLDIIEKWRESNEIEKNNAIFNLSFSCD